MTPKAAERDMTAHIPEGSADDAERDMTGKTNDLGAGIHKNSKTFGTVVSDYESDAAGLTPEKMAQRTEDRKTEGKKTSKK
jgi:hypothetical protein